MTRFHRHQTTIFYVECWDDQELNENKRGRSDKPLKGSGSLLSASLLEGRARPGCTHSKAVVDSAHLCSRVTTGIMSLGSDLPRLAVGLGVVPGAKYPARGTLLPPKLSLAENG